jgi:carbonic anhydrase
MKQLGLLTTIFAFIFLTMQSYAGPIVKPLGIESVQKIVSASPAADAQKKKLYAEAPAAPTPAADADEETDKETKEANAPATLPKIQSQPAPPLEAAPEVAKEKAAPKMEAAEKEKPVVAEKPAAAPAEKPAAAATEKTSAPAVAAGQSLKWLENGNVRYMKKHFRADGRLPKDRERNALSQHPHAIVLSCADSRVAPEIVFDQGIGEIFTIRVAGEALDNSVIASIEYAVEHLGPKLLVVMGHTRCGAVDAAINAEEGKSAGSPALDKMIADIKPRLKTIASKKPSENLEVESALNADGVARDLLRRSDIIRAKVEAGELTIKPALYWIDSGQVKFY